MVTHETRIREVPGSNPWAANLVEVFSGFLNLKIAKELVIFKDKCRVGPHILEKNDDDDDYFRLTSNHLLTN